MLQHVWERTSQARYLTDVVIATRKGGYRVDEITPPGKRTMTPAAFLRGRHSSEGRR